MEFTTYGHARIRGLLFRYAAQVNYYQKVKTEGKVVKDKEEEDSLTSSKQIATTTLSRVSKESCEFCLFLACNTQGII